MVHVRIARNRTGSTHYSTLRFRFQMSIDCTNVANDSGQSTEATHRHLVLYVEDNVINLRLMQKVLARRHDIELISAETGEAGLVLASARHPALVLMDINLPGISGLEAMQRLRQAPSMRAIPVLAVTANAMKEDIERGLAAGFDAYLTKPFNVRQLYELLDHYLNPDKKVTA